MTQLFELARQGALGLTWFIILVSLLQIFLHVVQLCFAAVSLHKRPPHLSVKSLWQRYADHAPPIAIVVPAYNEELTISDSVEALLSLHYPEFEVIVVNDGSRDGTLSVLVEHFALKASHRNHEKAVPCSEIIGIYANPDRPRLVVIDKVNGGKGDAINAGINVARAPLVCVIDADTLMEPDALIRVARPFIDDPAGTVAVGGTIRVVNGCRVGDGRVLHHGLPRNLIALLQVIEYGRAFLMMRQGQSYLGLLMIISGAFGVFQRSALIEIGGYSTDTVGEDFELIVKLHRHARQQHRSYKIQFVPDPVCWTEVPGDLRTLGRQRARWQRGALETFFKHRTMLLNPRYGRIGLIAFCQVFLVDILGPVAELLGYLVIPPFWLMSIISFAHFKAFFGVVIALGIFVTVATLILEEIQLRHVPRARDLLVLAVASVLENFGYRQINSLWRLRGCWQFLRKEQGWGKMTRSGFQKT